MKATAAKNKFLKYPQKALEMWNMSMQIMQRNTNQILSQYICTARINPFLKILIWKF